jgi:hypothetical protein
MLEKLLERISQGGTFSVQALAHEWAVTEDLMEAMLSDLERAGYLRLVEACGEGACGACTAPDACKTRGRVWIVADVRQAR